MVADHSRHPSPTVDETGRVMSFSLIDRPRFMRPGQPGDGSSSDFRRRYRSGRAAVSPHSGCAVPSTSRSSCCAVATHLALWSVSSLATARRAADRGHPRLRTTPSDLRSQPAFFLLDGRQCHTRHGQRPAERESRVIFMLGGGFARIHSSPCIHSTVWRLHATADMRLRSLERALSREGCRASPSSHGRRRTRANASTATCWSPLRRAIRLPRAQSVLTAVPVFGGIRLLSVSRCTTASGCPRDRSDLVARMRLRTCSIARSVLICGATNQVSTWLRTWISPLTSSSSRHTTERWTSASGS